MAIAILGWPLVAWCIVGYHSTLHDMGCIRAAASFLALFVATDMAEGAQNSSAFADKVIPRVPARRWGEPEDFGGVAVYLTSNASAYHSGDLFVIDGGYSIF